MREIRKQEIVDAVKKLCIDAAVNLPQDVQRGLGRAKDTEQSKLGRSILDTCIENAHLAARLGIPICQDTGFAVFFVEMGNDIHVQGGTLESAIQEGTAFGYTEGYLRKSIVADPLFDRRNTGNNVPAVIHLSLVEGDLITITIAPKGAGSENMSDIAMLKPSDGPEGVIDFVTDVVIRAGANPCPPVIVGVGIGGTFEMTALLAKKALLRQLGAPHPDGRYAKLENELLRKINSSGIGPQGLGGASTALAVHIETMPCHIASLPVAVNINCHAARHASVVI